MINKLSKEVFNTLFEAYTLDENNKLKVVNEDKAKKAQDLYGKIIEEYSKDWWADLESNVPDLIKQVEAEMQTASPADLPSKVTEMNDMHEMDMEENMDEMFKEMDELEEFGNDLKEMDEDSEEDEDLVDGDEDYENMLSGYDEAGMGSKKLDGSQGEDFSDMSDEEASDMDSEEMVSSDDDMFDDITLDDVDLEMSDDSSDEIEDETKKDMEDDMQAEMMYEARKSSVKKTKSKKKK